MNLNLSAGGFIIKNQERQQLPLLIHPSVTEMRKLLTAVEGGDGIINITNDDEPDIGVQNLELYAENHRYLIMLYEIDEAGEPQVRLPIDNGASGLEEFFGELYPAHGITQDFQAVSTIFETFILTGNLTEINQVRP
ncbi:MAG: hypothetical protein RL122_465 [Pseudomonadota bacterium]|jgi:hypothetical protein